MEKKIIIIVLVVVLIILLTNCNYDLGNINKEEVLEKYNKLIGVVGNRTLNKNRNLKGIRKFGIDKYVGTYKVEYNNFTGEEILFGGTNIERNKNNELEVRWDIEIERGDIKVLYYHGSEKSKKLNVKDKKSSRLISINPGSQYISLKASSFSGKVKITVNGKQTSS